MGRSTQPYKKHLARPAGATLAAMIRGRSAYMANPQDARRKAKKMLSKRVSVQKMRNSYR